MIKIVFKIVKKVVVAIALLYSFNLLVSYMDILIPINYISIGTVSLLGIPGLLSLLTLHLIIF